MATLIGIHVTEFVSAATKVLTLPFKQNGETDESANINCHIEGITRVSGVSNRMVIGDVKRASPDDERDGRWSEDNVTHPICPYRTNPFQRMHFIGPRKMMPSTMLE